MRKVKVSKADTTPEEMERIKKLRIAAAKRIYDAQPFITKVYMAMNYKFPIDFLIDNWKEITEGDEDS